MLTNYCQIIVTHVYIVVTEYFKIRFYFPVSFIQKEKRYLQRFKHSEFWNVFSNTASQSTGWQVPDNYHQLIMIQSQNYSDFRAFGEIEH